MNYEHPPQVGGESPWGTIDQVEKLANGIYRVHTPSHGGVWLSEGRVNLLPEALHPSNLPWFEEDCEASYIVLAFPRHFDAPAHSAAVVSAFHFGGQSLKRLLAEHYTETRDSVSILGDPDLPPGYRISAHHDDMGDVYGYQDNNGESAHNAQWDEHDAVMAAWENHYRAGGERE